MKKPLNCIPNAQIRRLAARGQRTFTLSCLSFTGCAKKIPRPFIKLVELVLETGRTFWDFIVTECPLLCLHRVFSN